MIINLHIFLFNGFAFNIFAKVIETKLQKTTEEALRTLKEKETLQEELNEKERQANSQELVCFIKLS